MVERMRRGIRPVTEQSHVTSTELFFDLVFVFAFLEVDSLLTAEKGLLGVLHGLLVLIVLWWLWSLFAWLGNRVRANYGLARLTLLAAIPVMFALAATILETFKDFTGGVAAPLWFVGCYVVVRALYLVLRLYSTPRLRARDVVPLTVPALIGVGLLFSAALLPISRLPEKTVQVGQVALWASAVMVDYGVGLALAVPAGTIFSARHWAERHNLIIILALGEVLVSVGILVSDLHASGDLLLASALTVVVAGALEWIYFDFSTLAGEHALLAADPSNRVRLARDAYTYLHLPMIAGITLLSLGLKHVPALIMDSDAYNHSEPLDRTGRYAMYGGVALFLLANAGFQWRLEQAVRIVVLLRLATAALLLALLPVTARIPSIPALALLAALCLAAACAEFLLTRRERLRLRKVVLEETAGEPASADDRIDWGGPIPS